ncbi:MAG: type II secretion system protein [Magnetococcales bacterium]|nr:type II secretion system protein [Magnetococcales bacterium]
MNKRIAAGFSLIELSIAMVIVGILIAIGFSLVPNYLQSAKYTAARAQMKEIQAAIEGFAIANNRLPCPSLTVVTATTYGQEAVGNTTANICDVQHDRVGTAAYDTGDLPYRTLGLATNRDPWGRPIKYAVLMDQTSDGLTICNGGACCGSASYPYSCDLATKYISNGSSTTNTRTDFCSKLSFSTKHSQNAASTTKDIYTARVLTRGNPGTSTAFSSLCNTGTTVEGSVAAYILASSGVTNADTTRSSSTGNDRYFDGKNYPGTSSFCFESPDRPLALLDGADAAGNTTGNYDDIVYAGSIPGLMSTLQCN